MSRLLPILICIIIALGFSSVTYGALTIPGTQEIQANSIAVATTGNSVNDIKGFGLSILGILRVVASGFALIYIVMIGVQMIIGSDSDETVKTQKKQITYTLIGFLFLNIPSFVYQLFTPGELSGSVAGVDNWNSTRGSSIFWNTAGFEGLIGNMIAFFRVFIFGTAVLMFTWGIFNMLVSGGDEEKKKQAKNRFIYGIIGLMFLGFVELWGNLIAVGDFKNYIPSIGNTAFSLVMYLAAPISIFMLIWGAYYWITSAGDEERMKKGKSIIINTGIAIIILLAGLSFMTELVKFQL